MSARQTLSATCRPSAVPKETANAVNPIPMSKPSSIRLRLSAAALRTVPAGGYSASRSRYSATRSVLGPTIGRRLTTRGSVVLKGVASVAPLPDALGVVARRRRRPPACQNASSRAARADCVGPAGVPDRAPAPLGSLDGTGCSRCGRDRRSTRGRRRSGRGRRGRRRGCRGSGCMRRGTRSRL